MITIIDYGVGNVASIRNMLRKAGAESSVTREPEQVLRADKLILPGVGAYDHAVRRLRDSELLEPLEQRVLRGGVPILGICLGFQLLSRRSEEGREPGLGWLEAETVRFDETRLSAPYRVPHMGWTEIQVGAPSQLFKSLPDEPRFYFVHSYHVVSDSPEAVTARATHGYPFVAAMECDNVVGVQFHPEKSHNFGLRLLQNFVECY